MKNTIYHSLSLALLPFLAIAVQSCSKGGTAAPSQTLGQTYTGYLNGRTLTETAFGGSSDNGGTWTTLPLPEPPPGRITITFNTGGTFSTTEYPANGSLPATNTGSWSVAADGGAITFAYSQSSGGSAASYPIQSLSAGGALVIIDKADPETENGVTYAWLRATYD